MSIRSLQEYTRFSKYAKYNAEKGRRESWDEQVERVFDMHQEKLGEKLYSEIKDDIEFAKRMVLKKRVLGSQRALQFGGLPILTKNARIFNCLHKSTDFITENGVRRFSDFSNGDETVVLSHLGTWENAIVRNYGDSTFNKITFSKGKSRDFVVYATPDHRWILKDGKETTSIKEGDQIFRQPNTFNSWNYENAEPMEKLYWAYGLVAGDGSLIYGAERKIAHSIIRLCGHDKQYQSRFEELGFKTSSPLSVAGDFFAYTGTYLKTLPNPKIDDVNLLRAFCRGLLDADGEKNRTYRVNNTGSMYLQIQQSSKEVQDFIRNVFPVVGIYIISETKCTRETNFGVHDAVQFRVSTSCEGSSPVWRVKEIEEEVFIDEAWCLEVENCHSFVMPNGITTGNCTVSYCDRPRFFQECIYLLLCGCGCGFSVQKHHVEKLPKLLMPSEETKQYVIPDSIEGWSDALGVLMSSFFDSDLTEFKEYKGLTVEFDYSSIRPEGAMLSSGGKAPGPEGLRRSIEKIRYLLKKSVNHYGKLRPVDAYDVCMHASDAVLSGGIRRSASIAIFSVDDDEMINAKTGSWFVDNPQRGRSNNSALLVRNETTREQFSNLIKSVKEFGEPGFIWADEKDVLCNPCVEIAFCAYLELSDPKNVDIINSSEYYRKSIELEKIRQNNSEKLSGWSFCNLCEINMKKCKTEEEFLESCRAASIIGSIQASYDNFPYLGGVTDAIVKREALLGVSMTGMADSPEIAFNAEIQRKGAKIVLDVNEQISKKIGTNICARATCVKPAGSTSCILGSASGIHPHHAKRYLRRVQANKLEIPLQFFQKFNPLAVEESVWSANNTDVVVTFLCEVPDGVKTKNQVNAITLLENVKLTQQNWVEYGTRQSECIRPYLRHNVSNTCTVKPEEWGDVEKFIYDNRKWFTGVSLLPSSGDKDYPQAPFTAVYTPLETVRKYGDGSLFASGLIVDGHHAFNNDLWAACDCALGVGEILGVGALREKIANAFKTNGQYWKDEGLSPDSPTNLLNAWLKHNVKNYLKKVDWVRRAQQFSNRYFNNDLREMTYCLKDVYNWKVWCDLSREYVEVDWSQCFENEQGELDTSAGSACSGGQCELGDLGLMIAEKQKSRKNDCI